MKCLDSCKVRLENKFQLPYFYMVSELLWLTSSFFFFNGFLVFFNLLCQHCCLSFSHLTFHYSPSDHHQTYPWQLPIVESSDCSFSSRATYLWLSQQNHTYSTSNYHCCSWWWYSNSPKSTPSSSFLLHDVLHVPHITKNLISVHKFTIDTNTSIELHSSYFFVKDRTTGRVPLRGPSRDGLYLFPSTSNKLPLSWSVFVGECASPAQWHSQLGHLAFCIVNHVFSKFSLPVISVKIVHPCTTCFGSKSKQLSFSLSCTQINFPLVLIHI